MLILILTGIGIGTGTWVVARTGTRIINTGVVTGVDIKVIATIGKNTGGTTTGDGDTRTMKVPSIVVAISIAIDLGIALESRWNSKLWTKNT